MSNFHQLPDLKFALTGSKMKHDKIRKLFEDYEHQYRKITRSGDKPIRGIGFNRWWPYFPIGKKATDAIEMYGHLIGREDSGQGSVLAFQDVLVSIWRTPRGAELRLVKKSDPKDMHRDLPALALLTSDKWLDADEVARRRSPPSDTAGSVLIDRLCDVLASVPLGTVQEIRAWRGTRDSGEASVNLSPYDMTPDWCFVEAAAKHATEQAGCASKWELHNMKVHPSLESSWMKARVSYSVKPFASDSATLRFGLTHRAIARTRQWLVSTNASSALIKSCDGLRRSSPSES